MPRGVPKNPKEKIKIVCKHCGNDFHVYPSRFDMKYPPSFCSKECSYADQKVRDTENRKDVTCDQCGIVFRLYNYRLKTKSNCCSMKCLGEFRSKQVEVPCENCGSLFKAKKARVEKQNPRYCSWKCRNEGFNGENSPLFTKLLKVCNQCGEEFFVKRSEPGKYCSNDCKSQSQTRERAPDFATFYYSPLWKSLRKACYERDQFKCTRCGTTEKILHVHHVIPRRLKGPDELFNLISVCNQCHGIEEGKIFKQEKMEEL